MVTVNYWFGSWVAAPGSSYLRPGDVHHWVFWGFNYGDVMDVTAHPVVLENEREDRILAVQDLRIEGDLTGRRLYFTVINAGTNPVPGYGLGISRVGS